MGSITSSEEEISLGLMHCGGLTTMLSGAGFIIGLILAIVTESRVVLWLSISGVTLTSVGFVLGLVVWGSGWMLREE